MNKQCPNSFDGEMEEYAEAFNAGWEAGRKDLMKHLCSIPLDKALGELARFAEEAVKHEDK